MKPHEFRHDCDVAAAARARIRSLRLFASLALGVVAGSPGWAADSKPAQVAAPVTIDTGAAPSANWITFSAGRAEVEGSRSAFQERVGLPADKTFRGVDDFHLEKAMGKQVVAKVDGHGFEGSRDRELKLDLAGEGFGFLRGGIRETRSYFNGSGGYFPGSDIWQASPDSELHADRNQLWVEGGLKWDNLPNLRLRFSRDEREGRKDSTIWGRINTAFGPRSIGAAVRDLDENREAAEAEISYVLGKTRLGVRVGRERTERDEALKYRDLPGTTDSYLTQSEGLESKRSQIYAWSNTWFSETTSFTSDYRFTRSDDELSGSRLYGNAFDAAYNRLSLRGPAYTDLVGDSQFRQHAIHFGFTYALRKTLLLLAGFKATRLEKEAAGQLRPFNPGVATGTNLGGIVLPDNRASGLVAIASSSDQASAGPRIELRSTAWANLLVYVRGEWELARGNLQEASRPLDGSAFAWPTDMRFQRDTDHERLLQRYAVGATWNPARTLGLTARYDLRVRQSEYDHLLDTTLNGATSFDRYPGYLRENGHYPHSASVRATWQPAPSFTTVTRYEYKISTVRTRADLLATVESADQTAHVVSQSVSWNPVSRLYVQGSLNYVRDDASSPVDGTASTPGSVTKAQNDYWFSSVNVGLAVARKTDLAVEGAYYRSDNYDPSWRQYGLPLGAGARERLGAVSITHRFTRHLKVTLRYSDHRSEDDAFGGRNDFEARTLTGYVRFHF
jgi:hypothetical protein